MKFSLGTVLSCLLDPIIRDFRSLNRFLDRKIYGNLGVVLDLGCGVGIVGHKALRLRSSRLIGVDINSSNLRVAKRFYSDVIVADIRRLPVQLKKVNTVAMIDVLEHLETREGERLLDLVKNKNVILSTPSKWSKNILQSFVTRVPYDKHFSLWSIKDLKTRGFHVFINSHSRMSRINLLLGGPSIIGIKKRRK